MVVLQMGGMDQDTLADMLDSVATLVLTSRNSKTLGSSVPGAAEVHAGAPLIHQPRYVQCHGNSLSLV